MMTELYRDCPCKGCETPVRHPGCHGKCERKAEWDRKKETIKAKINHEKEKDRTATAVLAESAIRTLKRIRRLK